MKLIFSITNDELGDGYVIFKWRPKGSYLAVSGSSTKTTIYDRYGRVVDEISQQDAASMISWNKDGDVLAVATGVNTTVLFWEIGSRKTDAVDMNPGSKDAVTFIEWSPNALLLAVGTSKGCLVLYNRQTAKKVLVLGKHQQPITCGSFAPSGKLGLGSDDGILTINNENGDTIHTVSCCAEPALLKFYTFKQINEKNVKTEEMLSVVLGGTILMIMDLNDYKKPINLQFQSRYGEIVAYSWYGNGYILLGFAKGYLVCVSAHASEIGQEIFSVQDFKNSFGDLYISESLSQVMVIGDVQLKIREIGQLEEVSAMYDIETEEKGLHQVEATDDGQMIAVGGLSGTLNVFLTRMPIVGAAYRNSIAILSSLTEVTVFNENKKGSAMKVDVEIEPSLIAIGPKHFAVGMNNRVWIYEIISEAELVCELQYLSSITSVAINECFLAAKLDGTVQLHKLFDEQGNYNSEVTGRLFPDPQHCTARIQNLVLTDDFFIYCTDAGHLHYYSLEYEAYVNEYKHNVGIKMLFPDPNSVRLCFFDERFDAYIYSPIDDSLYKLPSTASAAHFDYCMWENFCADKNVFVVCYKNIFQAFLFCADQINGQSVITLGTSTIPYGYKPLMLSKGMVHCQTDRGRTTAVLIEPLKTDIALEGKTTDAINKLLEQVLLLKRWSIAWKICSHVNKKDDWHKFGEAVLLSGELELAIRIYRQIGDVAMVWELEKIIDVEERKLILGHIALILGHYDSAEEYFLQSSEPIHALNMRRDLLHWEKALNLAKHLDPEQIPFISKEYAQQLAFTGNHASALDHYEEALILESEESSEKVIEHNESCRAGIAKACICSGDLRRGLQVASDLIDRTAKRDCAVILEDMKQYVEAGQLYELGQFYSRAAEVYLKAKNWSKVSALLPKVRSPKIHSQYAKIMESEKKFKQAALAYKNARDYDNLVRILLNQLNMPNEAIKIVKETKSIEGAKLIANFFTKSGNHMAAIQFLAMSHCYQEAFQLAENTHQMHVYAEAIDDCGTEDQFIQIAEYFLKIKDTKMAGKYFYKASSYWKALENLEFNGEDPEAMNLAIDCAVESKDPEACRRLVDFLMGDLDGIPKDPKFLFDYYVAMDMKQEAATTAVIIALDTKNRGSYRQAHQCLFKMHQNLIQKGIQVPYEMGNILMLLHSYLIVKGLIKRNEHMRAARMLARVANNISKFPESEISILTAAAIECAKVGLKKSAFKYAAQIIKPDKRRKIDEKYQKKVETIVRKIDKSATDLEDSKSECPYCDNLTPETELVCGHCKNQIAYCVVTGRHVIKNDFALCPSCRFPGYYTEFQKLINAGETCPMCSESLQEVTRANNAEFFQKNKEISSAETNVNLWNDENKT